MKRNKALLLLLAFLSCSASAPGGFSYGGFFPVFEKDASLSSIEFQKFQEHTLSRLPNYKRTFRKYSEKYDLPWTLLAAVAYQESKWDEDAISHTGVRGLMQLTQQTADHVGVDDREDPYQSIRGGAYYLQYLYNKTPKKLSEDQRWAQALSAYNIGWGHLKDAQRLAIKLKKSPSHWNDLKTVFPLLEDESYAHVLRYGPARGRETVDFVENVFKYYKVLNRTFGIETDIAGL